MSGHRPRWRGRGRARPYLRVIFRTVDVGTSEWTLAGLARDIGISASVARYVPTVASLAAVVAMVPLRRRTGAWALAVFAIVLGAPAAGAHSLAGLLGALAPTAWRPEIRARALVYVPRRGAAPVEGSGLGAFG